MALWDDGSWHRGPRWKLTCRVFAGWHCALAAVSLAAALFGLSFDALADPLVVPVTRVTLPNGLTVLLHEDHSVPRIHIAMRYRVGSSSELPGRTGFAHLFEHLMFEGSRNVPEGKFDEWLEAAGGENNAYTSEDVTYYYEEVPANAAELPLFLESDRLGFFADLLSADLVEGQRDVVKNERRQSYMDRPWGKADLMLPEVLWPAGHPYAWPVIGSMEDLSAATIDDVRSFFSTWYVPANAILVVVGDFQTARMRRLVEHWFSDVPARVAPSRPARAAHRLVGEKRVVVEDALAPLPRLTLAWPSPELFHEDDASLDILAHALGTGAGARLKRRLMHELQIAQSVSVMQHSMDRAGMFVVEVVAQPQVALSELLRVIDAELARVFGEGLDASELFRARTIAETGIADDLDALSGKAARLSAYEAALGQADAFERDRQRYRSVENVDVMRSVRHWLGAGRVVMSVVPVGARDLAVINRLDPGGVR